VMHILTITNDDYEYPPLPRLPFFQRETA
jgi:hypothetical protein